MWRSTSGGSSEWFEFGFAELGCYLAKYAAFDDYCHRHESTSCVLNASRRRRPRA